MMTFLEDVLSELGLKQEYVLVEKLPKVLAHMRMTWQLSWLEMDLLSSWALLCANSGSPSQPLNIKCENQLKAGKLTVVESTQDIALHYYLPGKTDLCPLEHQVYWPREITKRTQSSIRFKSTPMWQAGTCVSCGGYGSIDPGHS